MLVLQRHKNESVLIKMGDEVVRVMVTKIEGGKIWLGFDAPQSVDIWRDELWASVQAGRQ